MTDKVTELLGLIQKDPSYTLPQIAEKLGISRKTVATYIKNLKGKGVIERVGSDRKGYWKINK